MKRAPLPFHGPFIPRPKIFISIRTSCTTYSTSTRKLFTAHLPSITLCRGQDPSIHGPIFVTALYTQGGLYTRGPGNLEYDETGIDKKGPCRICFREKVKQSASNKPAIKERCLSSTKYIRPRGRRKLLLSFMTPLKYNSSIRERKADKKKRRIAATRILATKSVWTAIWRAQLCIGHDRRKPTS